MRHKKSIEAGKVPEEAPGADNRERFVLHGGTDDVATAVPEEPEQRIDVEEALRNLGEPERRRTRVRRQSDL